MPRVEAREIAAHDRRQKAGGGTVWRVLRGRGPKGTEEPLRAPQSFGREGVYPVLLHTYHLGNNTASIRAA